MNLQNVRQVLKYYQSYIWSSILIIISSTFFSLLDLLVPYILGQILVVLLDKSTNDFIQTFVEKAADTFHAAPTKEFHLTLLLSGVGVLTIVRSSFQPWLVSWPSGKTALKARRDHLKRASRKILNLPLSFYAESNSGRVTGQIARGVSNYTWAYPKVVSEAIPKLIYVFLVCIYLGFVQKGILLLFMSSFFLVLYIGLKTLKRILAKERLTEEYLETSDSLQSEMISNIKTVKSFSRESEEFERQKQRFDREYTSLVYRGHLSYVKLEALQKLLIDCFSFVILYTVVVLSLKNFVSVGSSVTILAVTRIAYSQLVPLTRLLEIISRLYIPITQFNKFLNIQEDFDEIDLVESVDDTVNHGRKAGKIEFSDVSFDYGSDKTILSNINLTIEPCQTVAFVGHSGAGKSTLFKLLLRYFEPTKGQILVDGVNIKEVDVRSYRQRLAIVHQDVDIFSCSLLDNLLYGNPFASPKQIERVCEIAHLNEFIYALPQGLNTRLGEQGVRLSGGQRQRLGIARALLSDPDILLFDEATSNLDTKSERLIQNSMQTIMGARTTLIIAHRMATVKNADKIVVLSQGNIVEIGCHKELMKNRGVYFTLSSGN